MSSTLTTIRKAGYELGLAPGSTPNDVDLLNPYLKSTGWGSDAKRSAWQTGYFAGCKERHARDVVALKRGPITDLQLARLVMQADSLHEAQTVARQYLIDKA